MSRLERSILPLALFLVPSPLYAAEGSNLPRITNFAIVAIALILAVRKPLADYLRARTDQIRAELADARDKTAKAEVELEQATALLSRLDDEVEKAKREAKMAAEAERERILTAAKNEAARIKEIARKEIDNEVENGRRKLYARATELSVALAHKKLEATMTQQDQSRLIDRSIEMLERSKS
jgi:F-type H+-transporting ATPase subunit b